MRVIAVIPSRFASTRLPGKPLSQICGKPMVQWVYERASLARSIAEVVVATDDERIERVVKSFGGKVEMTSPALNSGTDRVAAVATRLKADCYVNVQGDEPLIDPFAIDQAVELVTSGRFQMATAMTPLKNVADLTDLSVVKVIADKDGRSIYFSRLPIPYSRQAGPQNGKAFVCHRHVGLYVYTRDILKQITELSVSEIEKAESLEQLRALEAGISIGITEVDFESVGVDTPEDLEKVRLILEGRAKKNG